MYSKHTIPDPAAIFSNGVNRWSSTTDDRSSSPQINALRHLKCSTGMKEKALYNVLIVKTIFLTYKILKTQFAETDSFIAIHVRGPYYKIQTARGANQNCPVISRTRLPY